MELYRVLLVDDEEEIRVGISRKINWEALGFKLVGEAENGVEALELCEQLRPDVVLTDIKMPFMDGLELCRQLQGRLPAARLVVFSGFDEFEYARQAIGMNVSDYILKPINAAELSGVLGGIKTQLDEHRARQRDVEALRQRYEESLPLLREVFFTRLLDGRLKPAQVAGRAAQYDIDLPAGAWVVALVQVEELGEEMEENNELLLFSVRAFVGQQLAAEGADLRLVLHNDRVALVLHLGQRSVYGFIEALGRVCALAKSYLGLRLTIGVGRPCQGAQLLSQSAMQAHSALEYRVLVGTGRTIYLGDLEPDTSLRLAFDEADERELASVVKLGSSQQVEACVAHLMERVRQAGLALSQCHFFFMELMAALIRLARTANIPQQEVFGEGFTGTVHITDFASLEDLQAWYAAHCLRLHQALERQRADSANNTVEKAKAFIHLNYADSQLGVEALCDYLHLSPAYFSTLFKRQTGVGFAAYVAQVRMEAAKRLLRETDDKTYLIAEKTGYTDPNYFSYVFKRQVGCSPSQYRSGQGE